jgi:hypothetical protein
VQIPESPVAALALLLVLPASIVAFTRFRPAFAVILLTLVPLLFLPEAVGFDAPLIPPLDKASLPALCILIGVLITARKQIKAARPGRGLDLLLVGMLGAVIGTGLTNPDTLRYGPTVLQGYKWGEIVSDVIRDVLAACVPFFVGRVLFRSAEDARALIVALVIGGLVYVPLCALELRLSPFLHYTVYGFMHMSFEQAIRNDGWRPVCFMAHGLSLALFICAASIGAWVLYRARRSVLSLPPLVPALTLSILLALLNSLGALVYGLVLTPIVLMLRPKAQLRVAVVLALITALYPILRVTDVFPREGLVELAGRIDYARAESLDFRFTNEAILVEKALERPWFGWGGFGRTFVFDKRGEATSVPDGEWIISLGFSGFVGLTFQFGALLIPVWMAYRRIDRVPKAHQPLLGGMGLIATVCVLDLLPNGMFNNLPMFLSGALGGLAQGMSQPVRAKVNTRLLAAWLLLLQRARLARTAQRFPT